MRKALAGAVAAIICALPSLHGQYSWNVATGNWSDSGNWSPTGVPSPSDDVFVDNGGTATVNATALGQNVNVASGFSTSGNIQLISGASASFSSLSLGILGQGNLTATGSNTTLTVGSGGITIGSSMFGTGNLTLASGATASTSGSTTVGNFGTGVLVVAFGSSYNASASGAFDVGLAFGSTGSVVVAGNSTVQNAGTVNIGGAGAGFLTVENGSSFQATYLNVGNQPFSSGDVTISNATLSVYQDLVVGNFGEGNLTVTSGSTLLTLGSDHALGRDSQGNGTVFVTGTGSTWTFNGNLSIGESGTGRLEVLAGGTLSGNHVQVAEFDNSGLLRVSGTNSNATLTGNLTSQDRVLVEAGGKLQVQNLYMFNTANTTVMGTPGNRGVLEAFYVESQDSSDVLIFNGGVFRARGNSTEVFGGFSEFGPGGTLTIGAGGMFVQPAGYFITTDAQIMGSGSLVIQGTGTMNLTADNLYSGGTVVESGTLFVNNLAGSGTGSGAVVVQSGGTLGGCGTISGNVTIENGGTLAPGNSPGILNTGSLSVNGTLAAELNGTSPGVGYDQVNVTGSVGFLSGSTLSLTVGFTPSLGDLFFLVVNDGSDAISGLLNGWSQNATFSLGGYSWQISYEGDYDSLSFLGGNDLVLQLIPEPSTFALAASAAALAWLGRSRRRQG